MKNSRSKTLRDSLPQYLLEGPVLSSKAINLHVPQSQLWPDQKFWNISSIAHRKPKTRILYFTSTFKYHLPSKRNKPSFLGSHVRGYHIFVAGLGDDYW
jgi:hypothetical protein